METRKTRQTSNALPRVSRDARSLADAEVAADGERLLLDRDVRSRSEGEDEVVAFQQVVAFQVTGNSLGEQRPDRQTRCCF